MNDFETIDSHELEQATGGINLPKIPGPGPVIDKVKEWGGKIVDAWKRTHPPLPRPGTI